MGDVAGVFERLGYVIEFGGPGARAFFDEVRYGFAGRTFHTLGRPTDAKYRPDSITEADLLAITLLDVRLPPDAVRYLLEEGGREIARLIAELPDRDIWEVANWSRTGSEVEEAWLAWDKLIPLEGVGHVVGSKILARLRPRLFPVRDSVTMKVLDYERWDNDWSLFAQALADHSLRSQARKMAREAVAADVPLLRVLDAAIWMLGSRSKRVRTVLHPPEAEGTETPNFSESRTSFWKAVDEQDPFDRK